MSGGDLVGVWWRSERGLGIPLDTTQTPPKHPRHPPQTPLKTSPRHPPEPCETPTRHPPNAFHTPTRPQSDPTQTQATHTPSHTPPETPSHPPPSTLRHPLRHHPGPSYRVWAITDGAMSLAVMAKLLDTQTCQYVKWKLRDCATSYRCFFYNIDTLF